MKVIDLLNKIANGEEVPKRIKYGGIVNDYEYLLNNIKRFSLNDEIEIIEDKLKEDNKIEHLKLYPPFPECTDDRFEYVENKINEIIDKVNGEDNE